MRAARIRGEVAIGSRERAHEQDARRAYGVRLNPTKSATIRFAEGDRVIVIAEDGVEEDVTAA